MNPLLIIVICGVLIVVAAALIEAYLKRNTRRRLADTQPAPGLLPNPEENPVEAARTRKQRLEKETGA